ncbi:P-selectin glycoprotein ligand 1-like [Hoplias malabaricus]|uniref:P-selectin glycoprotein ligand 1-like n=1 Tax=Hoplias malabaricus TaxID=27720 RepID=UPI003462144D
MMMAMTNRSALLLLLLTACSLNSIHVLCEDGYSKMNTTNSTLAQERVMETTPQTILQSQSTMGPTVSHTTHTAVVEEQELMTKHTTIPSAPEKATSQTSSKGNTTFGSFTSSSGPERANTTHLEAGTESLTTGEIPGHTESSVSSSHTSSSNSSAWVMQQQTTGAVTDMLTTPNGSPTLTTESSTTAKQTTSKSTTTKAAHVCPTEAPKREGLVGRCLIAIATLAALVTIFIMSTIILATKIAGRRYRRHSEILLQDTEMVCISALMNDTEHPIPKSRHPKSNGALIPNTEDEDGDDLTLNSFLPDTEAVA